MLKGYARERHRASTLESKLHEAYDENEGLKSSLQSRSGADRRAISSARIEKFKKVLRVFTPKHEFTAPPPAVIEKPIEKPLEPPLQVDEQTLQLRQNLEKMRALLKEKDKRIAELLQYEYGAKKAIEQKTWQQEELEKERQQVKLLEKEKESQLLTLLESRQHAQQLERAVQFLQQRNEELLLKKNQILEEAQETEAAVERLTADYHEISQQREQYEKRLMGEVETNSEQQLELKALYKQFESLKRTVEIQRQNLENQIALTDKTQASLLNVEGAKQQLEENFNTCQEEVVIIKQHLSKGMREVKELENRYCEAVAEKIGTLKVLHQQQREFDKQNQELIATKERLRNALEREKVERISAEEKILAFKNRNGIIEEELRRFKAAQDELVDKLELLIIKSELLERERDNFQSMMEGLQRDRESFNLQQQQLLDRLTHSMQDNALLMAQNEQMHQEITLQLAALDEKQHLLDEAHQHLAKKVRESALLHEKVEELTLQISEIDGGHAALQEASSRLQSDLLREEHEKKELSEKMQSLEEEIKKWEEKWQIAERRAQQAAEKITELEKIEQCHAQLQSLLSTFGPLPEVHLTENKHLEDPSALQRSTQLQFGYPLSPDGQAEEVGAHRESIKAYPNLFDLPASQTRPKQTLFD